MEKRELRSLINEQIFALKHDSHDVLHFARLAAAFDTATYFKEFMYDVKNFDSDLNLLSFAISQRTITGIVCEFGVAAGRTINHVASIANQTIYGFDSFEGLPEAWRTGFEKGAFKQVSLPSVLSNVILEIGTFDQSIPKFILNHAKDQPISLMHIDCDLYSSTSTIFDLLGERIVTGTIIVFDEYFNYPGWRHGEFQAFQEFISQSGKSYAYLGMVGAHQQVCVIIK